MIYLLYIYSKITILQANLNVSRSQYWQVLLYFVTQKSHPMKKRFFANKIKVGRVLQSLDFSYLFRYIRLVYFLFKGLSEGPGLIMIHLCPCALLGRLTLTPLPHISQHNYIDCIPFLSFP